MSIFSNLHCLIRFVVRQHVLLHVRVLGVAFEADGTDVWPFATVDYRVLFKVGSLCKLFLANIAAKLFDFLKGKKNISRYHWRCLIRSYSCGWLGAYRRWSAEKIVCHTSDTRRAFHLFIYIFKINTNKIKIIWIKIREKVTNLCAPKSVAADWPFDWSSSGMFRTHIASDLYGFSGACRGCPATNSCCGIRRTGSAGSSCPTNDGWWCAPINHLRCGSTINNKYNCSNQFWCDFIFILRIRIYFFKTLRISRIWKKHIKTCLRQQS